MLLVPTNLPIILQIQSYHMVVFFFFGYVNHMVVISIALEGSYFRDQVGKGRRIKHEEMNFCLQTKEKNFCQV